MNAIDYARSFITFVTHGRTNNARLQVESVCHLTDLESGKVTDYYFFASCKSEDTFATRNLFYADNYDFCGVFSDQEYVLFRTHATHTDGFREEGLWRDRFEDVRIDIETVTAHILSSPEEIVEASLGNRPLVGRVDLEDRRLGASLEFPIKTMNANDTRKRYQVDTGPLPYPDLDVSIDRHIERLWPAYVAYNTPDFADFVIQKPYAVTDSTKHEPFSVTHYSKIVSHAAATCVLAEQ